MVTYDLIVKTTYGDFTYLYCEDYKIEDVFLYIQETKLKTICVKISEIKEIIIKINEQL